MRFAIHVRMGMLKVKGLLMTFCLLVTNIGTGYANTKQPLSCYQCRVSDDSLCTEDFLKPCPTNQAYDVCMTTVKKTATSEVEIIKECALGPCNLPGTVASQSLGYGNCPRDTPDYNCFYCCKDDGCNRSSAVSISGGCERVALLLALSAAVLVATFYRFSTAA